jgi:hypothetical protein
MTFKLSLPRNDQDKNYEFTFLDSTVSACNFDKGTRGNFMVRMLFDDFDKYFDCKFECPFKKQNFGFYNFIPNDNYLPPILFNRSLKFLLTVKINGKLNHSKNSIWLISMKITGNLMNQ